MLRYPQAQDSGEEQSYSVEAGDSEDDRDAYEPQEHLYWDECDLWGSACNPAAAYQTTPAAVSTAVDPPPVVPTVVIPSVDIMRQLQLRQAEAWQHVRNSYQVTTVRGMGSLLLIVSTTCAPRFDWGQHSQAKDLLHDMTCWCPGCKPWV